MRKSKFEKSRIIKAIKANENGQRVEDLCRELDWAAADILIVESLQTLC